MSETDADEEAVVRRLCSMEAPLSERLQTFSAFVREHALPFAEAYDELAARLKAVNSGFMAPDVGDVMPGFVLPDFQFKFHSLDRMLERGPVVISFNRGHWCPYCTVELSALKQALKEIAAAGGQVVSIMPDTAEFVGKVAADFEYAFPVLSDEGNGYSLSLNLVIWLGERIRGLDNALELALEKSQGNNAWFVPIPATFVVGADGRITARFVDPDFRKRMEVEDVLTALRRARS